MVKKANGDEEYGDLKNKNLQLNHLINAWEVYRMRMKDHIPSYENRFVPNLRNVIKMTKDDLKDFKQNPALEKVPILLADINAVVALQISKDNKDPDGFFTPHAIQMLGLFIL